jgi:hypothetical protein
MIALSRPSVTALASLMRTGGVETMWLRMRPPPPPAQ